MRLPVYFYASLTAALLAVVAVPARADVSANMHADHVLGAANNETQLAQRVSQLGPRFHDAARVIGLDRDETARLNSAIADKTLVWGVVPAHLDAMSGYRNGRVYALHNVRVPSGTMGWSLTIQEPSRTLVVYIPQVCGNLSLVTKPPYRLAYHPLPKPKPAPSATPAPPVVAVAPTPVPYAFPPAPAKKKSFFGWLIPFIAGPLIGTTPTTPTIGNPCPNGDP